MTCQAHNGRGVPCGKRVHHGCGPFCKKHQYSWEAQVWYTLMRVRIEASHKEGRLL